VLHGGRFLSLSIVTFSVSSVGCTSCRVDLFGPSSPLKRPAGGAWPQKLRVPFALDRKLRARRIPYETRAVDAEPRDELRARRPPSIEHGNGSWNAVHATCVRSARKSIHPAASQLVLPTAINDRNAATRKRLKELCVKSLSRGRGHHQPREQAQAARGLDVKTARHSRGPSMS